MPKCDFNKLQSNWHWCSPVNLLHIFRTSFAKNTSGSLLLKNGKSNSSILSFIYMWYFNPAGIYMFNVNNRNTRTSCEICLKLTIKRTLNIFHIFF